MSDLRAPYKKFRPTAFWSSVFAGGAYTGDIMDCPWACDRCWSRRGWKGDEPTYELTPAEVADKLVAGMRRNAQTVCRLSGGEPALHWDHTVEVVAAVLERTHDEVMVIPGVTDRRGEAMGIIIETNGAVVLTPQRIDQLERRFGEEAARVVLSLGIKATSGELLAELTGQTLKTAERFHAQQVNNLIHAAYSCRHLEVYGSFLDRFTDPRVFAALSREVERARPGMGRNLGILDYVAYRTTPSRQVPQAARTEHPDGLPADDEETITALSAPEGVPRRPQEIAEGEAEPLVVADRGGLAR